MEYLLIATWFALSPSGAPVPDVRAVVNDRFATLAACEAAGRAAVSGKTAAQEPDWHCNSAVLSLDRPQLFLPDPSVWDSAYDPLKAWGS